MGKLVKEFPASRVVKSVRVSTVVRGNLKIECDYRPSTSPGASRAIAVSDRVALAQWFESVINRAIEAQAARLADDDTRRRQTPGMHALLEQMRRGELVNDSNLDARLSRIEQLAAHPEDEFAWVCADCGQRIAAAAGFRVPDPFVNTAKLGNCGVCGQFGSINPSYDWTGRGD